MGGISTSETSDFTMVPKAPPMMMPTAMSTTLPLTANSLNSLNISSSFLEPPSPAVSPDNMRSSCHPCLGGTRPLPVVDRQGRLRADHQVRKTVRVEVAAYNSKVFYLITKADESKGERGDHVVRLSLTGKETLLDAMKYVSGILSEKRLRISRPLSRGRGSVEFPVNVPAIRDGSAEHNYQIFPGDRLFVELLSKNKESSGPKKSNGYYSREFVRRTHAGMVGINVGIPVPLGIFPFTGHKQSFFGDLHTLGKDGVRFYTETKTVTSRWFDEEEMEKEKVDTWDGTIDLNR